MVQLSVLHKFYIKRLGFYFLTFLLAVTLNFFLPKLRESNPVDTVLYKTNLRGLTQEQIQERRYEISERFGLDKPLIIQYFTYLKSILIPVYTLEEGEEGYVEGGSNLRFGFNFGYSILKYPTRVWDIIKGNIFWTLLLQVPAIVFGYIIGNILGALAAYKRGVYDKIIYPGSLVFTSIPYFCLGLIMVFVFGIVLEWFPTMGGYSDAVALSFSFEFPVSVFYHFILPFGSLFLVLMGGQAIGMRSMSIYELGADYVSYARYLGVNDNKIVTYVFRNAMLPQLTGIALALGLMVGGSLLIEIIFSYPGVGYAMFKAVKGNDYPVLQAGALIVAANVLFFNFVVDVLIAKLDPRVKVSLEAQE